MTRIGLWVAATLTSLVLLLGYHTSTSGALATGPRPALPGGSPGAAGTGSGSTVDGSVEDTRWGPVQVRLELSDGRITGVQVVQHPQGNPKDVEINDYALPILVQETTDAQSADIDMVSGATVTSDGYVRSLQSALDEAGL